MPEQEFEYEVAFSFLKEDEGLAVELNDLIQDRLSTFLYSRRQNELAGTDGEATFHDAFGRKSRIVVVLYRAGWGQTPWTRIEETAIRNRAFEHGYEFVIFVPLDETALPKWLPKTQIWVGIERWGVSGAAAVIEARVQGAGGSPREESVEDKAARFKRAMDYDTERKRFLNSEEGVSSVRAESERLYEIFVKKVESISGNTEFPLRAERTKDGLDVCASFGCLAVDWRLCHSNTLDESELSISLWNAKPPRPGRMFSNEPRKVRAQNYEFDKSRSGEVGWRESRGEKILSSEQVADLWLGVLMEHAHDQKRKHRR